MTNHQIPLGIVYGITVQTRHEGQEVPAVRTRVFQTKTGFEAALENMALNDNDEVSTFETGLEP